MTDADADPATDHGTRQAASPGPMSPQALSAATPACAALQLRRHWRLFLLARTVSWTGSAVTLVALPLLLYQRSGSATLTGLLTTVEGLPYLLLGLPAGALVDRWDQRRVLIATSIASGVLIASVPAANQSDMLSTAQLFVVAAGTAALFVFFDAAGFGVVPALVGRDNVGSATSSMMSIYTVIGIAGPALGGAAAAAIGPPPALLIDAVSYLIAGVLLSRLHWPSPQHPPAAGIAADIAAGLRYIRTQPIVRSLTLLGVGNSLTAGAITGLIVVVAVHQLHLPGHSSKIGLLFAAASLGALLGSLVLLHVQRHLPVGVITLAALAANLAAVLAWSRIHQFEPALALIALVDASTTAVSMNGIVVRQTITPTVLQGRVNTTARMIAFAGQPAGAALGGLTADAFGVSSALLLAGAGVAAALIVGIVAGLHRTPRLTDLTTPA